MSRIGVQERNGGARLRRRDAMSAAKINNKTPNAIHGARTLVWRCALSHSGSSGEPAGPAWDGGAMELSACLAAECGVLDAH